MNFEITAMGFDAATDATDERVMWVSAPDRGYIDRLLMDVPYQSVSELPTNLKPSESDIDYKLPYDHHEIRLVLNAYAADAPKGAEQ